MKKRIKNKHEKRFWKNYLSLISSPEYMESQRIINRLLIKQDMAMRFSFEEIKKQALQDFQEQTKRVEDFLMKAKGDGKGLLEQIEYE